MNRPARAFPIEILHSFMEKCIIQILKVLNLVRNVMNLYFRRTFIKTDN
jgi:hypothetical protein